MAGLQRSAASLRRQGSSGLALGRQRFFSGELNQVKSREQKDAEHLNSGEPQPIKHSRSEGDLYNHGGKDLKANIASLKRSTKSFRRQGSSGVVWDDSFFAAELMNQEKPKEQQKEGETKVSSVVPLTRTPQMVARTPQRTPSQPRRIVRYRCCGIFEDVVQDSVVQVSLSPHRPSVGNQSYRLPAGGPIKNGTKPRKDWHRKN